MKRKTIFEASDGTHHANAAECKAHEDIEILVGHLVGLSEEKVRAALNYWASAIEYSEAIERAGAIIAGRRRAAGDLKRARKASADASMAIIAKHLKDATK